MNGNMKRSGLFATVLLICVGLTASAQGASFDCEKAGSKVEHMICDYQKLSELDGKLGLLYRDVLRKADAEQKMQIAADQKHWLKFARDYCETTTCLKIAYRSRQAALETYFEPRSPLYQHESEKAEVIKHVLATASLYSRRDNPFCAEIFNDLKQMKGVDFVDPVVQSQSYEDPTLDPWKKQCRWAPPFNFSYWCEQNIEPANADEVVEICDFGFGLPPFKLYELPPDNTTPSKRYILYTDDAYGPMNRDWNKPTMGGGGFAGFKEIDIAQCVRWDRQGGLSGDWVGLLAADAGQGSRNGKNVNSIIKYKSRYYFLILHEKNYGGYALDIEPAFKQDPPRFCRWVQQ